MPVHPKSSTVHKRVTMKLVQSESESIWLTLLADPEHIRQHLDDFGPDTWGTPLEARNLDWEVLVASDILLCKSVHPICLRSIF